MIVPGGHDAALIVIKGSSEPPAQPAESTAWIEKQYGPVVVGVPESVPSGKRVNPGGSDPVASENVYGPVPPPAMISWLYGVPMFPFGRAVGEMLMSGQATQMVYVLDA